MLAFVGHMHTQRRTQGPYMQTRVREHTQRNTKSPNLSGSTCSQSTIPAALLRVTHCNTHTHTSIATQLSDHCSLYTNTFCINKLSHRLSLIWAKHTWRGDFKCIVIVDDSHASSFKQLPSSRCTAHTVQRHDVAGLCQPGLNQGSFCWVYCTNNLIPVSR